MSYIKSFSVGNGDMFYIDHNSDNFTTIDCCLNMKDGVKDAILDEIAQRSQDKGIKRFISTHPDEDHISGLKEYNDRFGIVNFYRVDNKANKDNPSEDFKEYCKLRDDSKHNFSLKKDCKRLWMNQHNEERDSSGIDCLWPITSNEKCQEALDDAANGESPNNISPAIRYHTSNFSFLWMGDMETDMQQEFNDSVTNIPKATVVFAPHHGRKSGHIPADLLSKLNPKLIIVGEAPSEDLDYYQDYDTITQNTAGDISFKVQTDYIHIYVSEPGYSTTANLEDASDKAPDIEGMYYIGSIKK